MGWLVTGLMIGLHEVLGAIQVTVASLKPKQGKKKSAAQQLWFLHWLMAGFYLLLFLGGKYMVDMPRSVPYRRFFYSFHETLGVVVMSLLLARIFVLLIVLRHKYRRRQPNRTQDWLQTFALHTALYFFMFLVPFSGYLASNFSGHEVIIFGTNITLPRLVIPNKFLATLSDSSHSWLSFTFLAFTILHMVDQWKYLRAQLRRFSKATIATIASGLNRRRAKRDKQL